MSTQVETKELIPLSSKNLIEEAVKFLGDIQEIKIENDQQYNNALELCKSIKSKANGLEKDRKVIVAPLNQDVKTINAEYKSVTLKLDNAERRIKSAASVYWSEKERKRLEEQRKRDAEAEEQKRKAEEAARKEMEKEQSYREQGRDDMADKAAARAETHIDRATNTVALEVEKMKVSGVHYRTDYEVQVLDKRAAVNDLMASNNFSEHVIIDVKAIAKVAKAFKGKLNIDGLKIIEKKTPVVRGS